jgi:hypothetical protein
MSDSVRVTNLPESGSTERIAFDLAEKVMSYEDTPSSDKARDYILDLYAYCLIAARGFRKVDR